MCILPFFLYLPNITLAFYYSYAILAVTPNCSLATFLRVGSLFPKRILILSNMSVLIQLGECDDAQKYEVERIFTDHRIT